MPTSLAKRAFFQFLILCIPGIFFVIGYFSVRHVLDLPFRAVNDALHRKDAAVNLDFLIPARVHIDEKTTIGQVVKLRFSQRLPFFQTILDYALDRIPTHLRILLDALLVVFWSFLYMTFLRVFTLMRYVRAIAASLVMGGFTYWFLPDFSPGRTDDAAFLGIIAAAVAMPKLLLRRSRKKQRRLSTP